MGAQPQPWQIFPQSIDGGCSGLLILRVRFDSLWGEHNTLLTPNFNVMKKVISLIKRGIKAYSRQAAKSYVWIPSGTIPVGI